MTIFHVVIPHIFNVRRGLLAKKNDRAGFELRTSLEHMPLSHAQDNDTTNKNLERSAPSYKAVMNAPPRSSPLETIAPS